MKVLEEKPQLYYDMAKRMDFKVSKRIAEVIARDSFLSFEFCYNKKFNKVPENILLSCLSSQNNCINYVDYFDIKNSPKEIIDLIYNKLFDRDLFFIKNPIKINYDNLMNLSFEDELYRTKFIYENLDNLNHNDQLYILALLFKFNHQLGWEAVCKKFECDVYHCKKKCTKWIEQKDFVYCFWYSKYKIISDKAKER